MKVRMALKKKQPMDIKDHLAWAPSNVTVSYTHLLYSLKDSAKHFRLSMMKDKVKR